MPDQPSIPSRFDGRDPGLTCSEVIELVTDYLDGVLDDVDVTRFEAHVAACEGCGTYLDQIRRTVALTGTLREDDVDVTAMSKLLEAFRDWKRAG